MIPSFFWPIVLLFTWAAATNGDSLPACRMLRESSGGGKGGRIVVIGDIHGSNAGLKEILYCALVIDSTENCKWSKKEANKATSIVQMGDLVDRGEEATEAWDCLDELQASMPNDGESKMVRIIGNHEIWWLEGKIHMRARADTHSKIKSLVRRMKSQIQSKDLVGAQVIDVNGVPILFVHAGYRTSYLKAEKIKEASGLAESFNKNLHDSLTAACPPGDAPCDFDLYGELFQAGPERGGSGLGGPVWTDFNVLVADDKANGRSNCAHDFIQIVGHSSAVSTCDDGDDSNGHLSASDYDSCKELIRATGDCEAICVDGGMTYGLLSFLEINKTTGQMLAHEREPPYRRTPNGSEREPQWSVRILNDDKLCA